MRFFQFLILMSCICFATLPAICQTIDTIIIPTPDDPSLSEVIIKSGSMLVEQGFMRDNQKTGAWRKYGEQGNMVAVAHFSKGMLNGLKLSFNNTNVLTKEENYLAGDLHGLFREYNSTRRGSIRKEAYYKYGQLEGIKKEYFDDGKILSEVSYSNGKKNGESLWYFQNGHKSAIYSYTNDTIDGTISTWHDNGQLRSIVNYIKGKQHGDFKEYYANGNIKTIGRYDHDAKIGEWMYFNLEGDLASKELFAN